MRKKKKTPQKKKTKEETVGPVESGKEGRGWISKVNK
jgi:hypothetical protein